LGLVCAEGLATAAPPAPVTTTPSPEQAAAPEDSSVAARTEARSALAHGNKLLRDGDVAGAIDEYRRAQTVYPPSAPKIEFNIAKAEETRGDEPAAAAAFERFLSQSLEIPPEYREEARAELHRLSTALGTLQLTEQRPGYAVVVDGQLQGKTPLDGAVWVRPGHHVLTLEEDQHVMFRDDVDVTGGATVQVTVTIRHDRPKDVALDTAPPPVAPETRSSMPLLTQSASATARDDDGHASLWSRWWFWAAAGAVVATGATVLLLSTRSSDGCPAAGGCQSVLLR
jgi:hypothetical protein